MKSIDIGKASILAESYCNIDLLPGDAVSLVYTDAHGIEREVVATTVDKAMSFKKAIIFENKDMIGGAFMKDKE